MAKNTANTEPTQSSSNIFGDPTVAETMAEDPLFRFLTRWWRQILVLIAAIAFGVYAKNKFHSTNLQRLSEASEVLESVSRELDVVKKLHLELAGLKLADPEKKMDKLNQDISAATTRLNDLLVALENTREPYSDLVGVYRTLLTHWQLVSSNGEANEEDKKAFAALAHQIDPLKQKLSGDRQDLSFTAEFKALVLAKSLMDSESYRSEAADLLEQLASNGRYTRLLAAMTFAKLAEISGEEGSNTNSERLQKKERAVQLLNELKSEYPEQLPQIEQELSRLATS